MEEFTTWMPISDAAKRYVSVWLYSADFVDEDFNPTGVVDGYWNDDLGWTVWWWNGCHDCYDTISMVAPTHFAQKVSPAGMLKMPEGG